MDYQGRIKEIGSVEALGAAVRELRRARGLTQAELAGRAGVSRLCISDLERAARGTRISSLLAVLGALGYEIDLHPALPSSGLGGYVASFVGQ